MGREVLVPQLQTQEVVREVPRLMMQEVVRNVPVPQMINIPRAVEVPQMIPIPVDYEVPVQSSSPFPFQRCSTSRRMLSRRFQSHSSRRWRRLCRFLRCKRWKR